MLLFPVKSILDFKSRVDHAFLSVHDDLQSHLSQMSQTWGHNNYFANEKELRIIFKTRSQKVNLSS